jgi:ERCC4-type nuclease
MKRPADPILVYVDNREPPVSEWPWPLPEFERERVTLSEGDYLLAAYPRGLVIERKTNDDLVNTIIHQRERFEREIVRLTPYHRPVVIVEGSLVDVDRHVYRSQATPASVIGLVNAMFLRYGVPFIWADNREMAVRVAQSLCRIYAREMAAPRKEVAA